MRRMKIFLPYVFVMLCGFYLLPLLLRSVVGETILLLAILPGLCLLCAVIYGCGSLTLFNEPLSYTLP